MNNIHTNSEIPLLINNLKISVVGREDTPLVDGVHLSIACGETLGLVGESGSGKSLTCMAALKLLPGSLKVEGEIYLNGEDVYEMSAKRLRDVRSNVTGMIFQEPMSSLNPVLTVKQQIFEALHPPKYNSKREKHLRAIELLELVGINEPERRLKQYPHEFSGGMCQRIMIALAIATEPAVLIADEPTTSLDVTIQAQVLTLLQKLTTKLGMSLLLVSHDLGVIAQNCDRVMIMYAGRIVEEGPVERIFNNPTHPYTEGLLKSLPTVDGIWARLPSLPGVMPTMDFMPSGCRFNNRCPLVEDRCAQSVPPLFEIEKEHSVACWVRGDSHATTY
jgi:oligopeptide/dipeptide ABC transporter ATP-binding protein